MPVCLLVSVHRNMCVCGGVKIGVGKFVCVYTYECICEMWMLVYVYVVMLLYMYMQFVLELVHVNRRAH